MRSIRFQGKRYVLIGTLEEGGSIATRADFIHGRVSFAHLCQDGRILRFNKLIGRREDITDLGERPTPAMANDAWDNMTTDAGGFPERAQRLALAALVSALGRQYEK